MASESEITSLTYVRIIPASEILPGERISFEVEGVQIALFNVDGRFYAIGDVCTHDNGPLGDGELIGLEVVCPRHGARFDVRTGQATRRPAVKNAPWYPTRIVDEMIEVGIPNLSR